MANPLIVAKNAILIVILIILAILFFLAYLVAYVTSIFSRRARLIWIEYLKTCYTLPIIEVAAMTSPATVKIYSTSPGMKFEVVNNQLRSVMCPRSVLISNHQIYCDWIYLWWLAYTAECHPGICIMLKDTLGKIPLFGWIMHCFEFMFITRSWENDEKVMKKRTAEMNKNRNDPLWLLMFPEGTVYNRETHDRTLKYADKANIPKNLIPEHMLLPRYKGLQTILTGLHSSVKVLYDITMVYAPVSPTGEPAETYYSLVKTFFKSEGAPLVQMHIREFAVKDIPYQDDQAFEKWMIKTFKEKDDIYAKLRNNELEHELRAEAPMKIKSKWHLYSSINIPLTVIISARLLYKYLTR